MSGVLETLDNLSQEFDNYRRTKMSEEKTVKDEIDEETAEMEELRKGIFRQKRKTEMRAAAKEMKAAMRKFAGVADPINNDCYMAYFARSPMAS